MYSAIEAKRPDPACRRTTRPVRGLLTIVFMVLTVRLLVFLLVSADILPHPGGVAGGDVKKNDFFLFSLLRGVRTFDMISVFSPFQAKQETTTETRNDYDTQRQTQSRKRPHGRLC